MARTIYACRFEIPTSAGLQPILDVYIDWIEQHYRERRGLPDFSYDVKSGRSSPELPPRHKLTRDFFQNEKAEVVRIQWTYPDHTDLGLDWRNDVRIGLFDGRASVEHLISIDSVDYRIAPTQLALGSPSVIRRLCSDAAVHIGDMKVEATPYPLDSGSVGQFLELLQSPMRRLPIVFLAPYASGHPNPVDAPLLARRLAAVGIVVNVRDPEVTFEIADEIGRALSCYNGGIRIYWPGFSKSQEPRTHRLYLGSTVQAYGPEATSRSIQRSIFAVAAFRFVHDQRISDVIRDVEQTERQQRVENQKASAGEDWESYALELDEKLSTASQMIADLQGENENLKANQQVYLSGRLFGEAEDESVADDAAPPDSVTEAVEQAGEKFKNLIILESALDAAKKSPFQRPEDILAALGDLNEIAADWHSQKEEKGSGGDLLQHLKSRGWGKRGSLHISTTTRTRYGDHYKFEYEGKNQFFEPHITVGSGDPNSCASIHFQLDQSKGKIVVAHVGRHLPNTNT